MAAITWKDVSEHAPELADSAVTRRAQVDLLAYVNTTVNIALLDGEDGVKTKLARVYLAAHIATMEKRKGVSGALTSQTAGPLSKSYAVMQWLTPSELSLTSYGLNYLGIVRRSGARGGFVL